MKPNKFKGKSLYYLKLKLSRIKFRLAYVAAFSLIQDGNGYLQYPDTSPSNSLPLDVNMKQIPLVKNS